MLTPSPSLAPHLGPEPASLGRGLSPRGPHRTQRAFPGKLWPAWKVPVYLEVITCNSSGCCRALDVKGNASGEHLSSGPESCSLRRAAPRRCHVSCTPREHPRGPPGHTCMEMPRSSSV